MESIISSHVQYINTGIDLHKANRPLHSARALAPELSKWGEPLICKEYPNKHAWKISSSEEMNICWTVFGLVALPAFHALPVKWTRVSRGVLRWEEPLRSLSPVWSCFLGVQWADSRWHTVYKAAGSGECLFVSVEERGNHFTNLLTFRNVDLSDIIIVESRVFCAWKWNNSLF